MITFLDDTPLTDEEFKQVTQMVKGIGPNMSVKVLRDSHGAIVIKIYLPIE